MINSRIRLTPAWVMGAATIWWRGALADIAPPPKPPVRLVSAAPANEFFNSDLLVALAVLAILAAGGFRLATAHRRASRKTQGTE